MSDHSRYGIVAEGSHSQVNVFAGRRDASSSGKQQTKVKIYQESRLQRFCGKVRHGQWNGQNI